MVTGTTTYGHRYVHEQQHKHKTPTTLKYSMANG